MATVRVTVDLAGVKHWESFHALFAETFGFPDFYGRNLDAWIDCMTDLDADSEMTSIKVCRGDVLVLELENMEELRGRCPDIYHAIIECSAFVNWRRIEQGDDAIMALSFWTKA